ncbi:MAG: hypothetical protein AB7E72_16255 [Lysobacterales bacterium]
MPADDIETRTRKRHDPFEDELDGPDDSENEEPEHSLDSEESRELLGRLKGWLQNERDRQRDNRVQMAMDEDYYDSIQWTEEERAIIEARGQRPVVINEIAPAIDWILGTERRTRVDGRILPRGPEDQGGALVMTKLAKFISDINKLPFCVSEAFAKAVKAGVGWLEIGARNDWEDDPLYIRTEDWRNIWHDSMYREVDASDMRYLFRARVLDLDVAEKMFPDRVEQLRAQATDVSSLPSADDDYELELGEGVYGRSADDHQAERKVVRIWEAWYREPGTQQILRGGRYSGRVYDPNNPAHVKQVEQGLSSTFDCIQMVVKFACFVDRGDLLLVRDSPYSHNRFPFVPMPAFRYARNGLFYGVIRRQRDPQDGLNKRRSKADFLLAVNRVIMEKGAVDDPEELRDEAARPDAVIEVNTGKELEIENNLQLATAHIQIEERDSAYIRQTSGVTGENLGLQSNATSGRAIVARQEQGNVVLTPLYDNKRLAFQLLNEIQTSLIGQFYTDERIIRIGIDEKSEEAEWLEINRWAPDEGIFKNDITAIAVDYIVSEQDYRESLRQAFFESMMDMMSRFPPEIAIRLLDLVIDMSDLPNKAQFLERIKEIVAPQPQQAPPPNPVAEAQAKKLIADSELTEAKARRERLLTLREALQGAGDLASAPELARIADEMIREIESEAPQAVAPVPQPMTQEGNPNAES